MNIAGEYRCLGEIDISPIQQIIAGLTDAHWDDDHSIKQTLDGFQNTQNIALVWDSDLRHKKPSRQPALNMFLDAIKPALNAVANFFESDERWKRYLGDTGRGYFIRAFLVQLKAGVQISEHLDKGYSLNHSHRIFIPILTNDAVFFEIDKMTLNLFEGEIVEVNNRMPHSIINQSNQNSIHLILDWVIPNEHCCCGNRQHSEEPCDAIRCKETDLLIEPCHCFKNDAIV